MVTSFGAKLESEKLEKENNNMCKIVGIIDDHYVLKTHKGLKKKIDMEKKKNIKGEMNKIKINYNSCCHFVFSKLLFIFILFISSISVNSIV